MAESDEDGVVFTEEAANRIVDAVRIVEQGRNPIRRPPGARRAVAVAAAADKAPVLVRCTSATADGDGNYPAIVTLFDGSAWQDAEAACVLKIADGSVAVSGRRYLARPSADQSGNAVFVADGNAWDFATHTLAGVISLVAQYLGAGVKTVDALGLGSSPTLYGSDGVGTLGGAGGLLNANAYLEPLINAASSAPGTRQHAGVVCYHTVITTQPDQAWVNYAGENTGNVSYLYWKVGPLGGSSGAASNFVGMALSVCDTGGTPAQAVSVGSDFRSWLTVAGVIEAYGTSSRFRARGQNGATGTGGGGDTVTGGIVTTLGGGPSTDFGTW